MIQIPIYGREIYSAFIGGILIGILLFASLDIVNNRVSKFGCDERCEHDVFARVNSGINSAKLTGQFNSGLICMDGGQTIEISKIENMSLTKLTFDCSGEACLDFDISNKTIRASKNSEFKAKISCKGSLENICSVTFVDPNGP